MAEDTPFMLSLTDEDINLAREAGFDISKYLPDDAANRKGYRPVEQSDRETSWADWGRALVGVGGSQLIADTAGGIEYLTKGAIGGDTRRYFEGVSQEQAEALSPVFRRAFESEVIPEEGKASIFDNFALSLGAKTVAALPSVVSSIIPAGLAVKALQGASLATRVAVAGAAARGTAGLQAGGGVASQIYSTIEKMSDQELQDKAPIYAGYRSMMPEAEARRQYMNEVAGAAPAAAFLLTAALGGVESQIAGRFAGEAARGVLRSAGRGAAAEAAQETVESGGGELLAQLALADQNLAQMNWQKILSKGLEGGLVGGALGGGVGGISGFGRRAEAAAPPPPAPPATTGLDTAPDVVPPKGNGTGAAPQPASGPQIGDPNARPTGSETQYPKARDPLDISTVEKRLAAKNIPFPEDRREEFQARIEAIRGLTKNRQPEFKKFLNQLYIELAPAATPTGTQTIAPGVQVGTGPDAAQTAALGVSLPVKPIPPQVSAIVQRGPTPAPVAPTPPARTAPALTPNVTAAMQRQTAPVDTGTNLQQPNADLLAEQKELISGQRAVQMFPKNTTPLPLPKGMKKSKTARGVFHYKPNATLPDGRKVTDGLIQQLSAAGRENELLGLGDRTKQEVAAAAPAEGGVTTVSEVTPEGARVRSVAATAADAERQAQMLQEEAAPENEVTIEPPAKALAPRVLYDITPESEAAYAAAEEALFARANADEAARLAKIKSEEKAEAVEGKVGSEGTLRKISKTALGVMKEVEAVAAEAFKTFSPTAKENMFFVGADESKLSDQDIAAAKSAMVARLKAMVKAYDDGIRDLKETYKGVKAAEGILKAAQRGSKQSDEIVFILRARHFVAGREATKSGGAFKTFADFAASELSSRGGREAAAEQRALDKEKLARKANIAGLKEGVVEDGATVSQTEKLVDTGLSPEENLLAAEEAEGETITGRERELTASAAARAADEDAIRAIESQEGKFKVAKRPVAEKLRPTVTGKISLKPKAAAAVAVAQKAEAKPVSAVSRSTQDGITKIRFGSLNFTLYGRGRGGGNQFVYRLPDGKSYSIDLLKDPREGGQGLEDLPNSALPEALHPIITAYVEARIDDNQLFNALKELEQQVQAKQLQPVTPKVQQAPTPALTRAEQFRQSYNDPNSTINDMRSNPDLAGLVAYADWLGSLTDAQWEKIGPSFGQGDNPFLSPMFMDPVAQRAKFEAILSGTPQVRAARGRPLQRANYRPITPTGNTVRMAGVDFVPVQATDVSRTLRLTSDDLYAIFRDGPARLFATFFKKKLTERVGNIPVYVITDEDMDRLTAADKWNQPWLADLIVNGLYSDGKIALRAGALADPVRGLELALHEALHAWSEDAINSDVKLQQALDKLVDVARIQYDTYFRNTPSIYGLTDRYEFISEAFSNPQFREFIANIPITDYTRQQVEQLLGPIKGPIATVWDTFVQMIRKAMGLGDTLANYTMLDAVMRAGARIDMIVERRGVIGDRLMQPQTPRASVSAQDIINSSVDRKNAFTSWSKESWAKFITLTQMSDQYENTVIGPALKKISDAVLGTDPRIKQLKEAGDALAARAVDLSRKNPDEFRKLVDIMEQARMLDISIEGDNSHLGKDATKGWRGKALLPELQAQFASIQDGELKQLYRDMAEFYRNSHNDIVKANVTSILEGMQLRQTRGKAKGNALTDQEIADLTKRVMDKTMTDADKTLLGPTIYNALKNAADFHRVKGDYFPLMRYGDYVVVTEDKITDTMGGTLETPDTVLFRDKSNTAARRAAEELATKSELRPLSVDKTYFDNATGKEVTEDEAKSLNDVDIGYRVTLQTQGVYFFESRTQAEEFARTNPEGHDVVRSPEKRKGSGYQAQTMTGSQISAINKGIEGRVKSGDITEGQANLLKSIVNQSATRMLGGNRITSRRLKAMKVTGASKEIERNLLQYNAAASRAIAVSESAPVIRDAFVELDDQLKGYAGADRPQLVAVVEEAKARIEQGIVAPNEPGKVMKDVMSLVFLARLFSPAYSVINGMQVSMVTVPVLGGRFGNMAAATEVGKAYSDIGFGSAVMQGIYNTARAGKQIARATLVGTDDIVGNMRKKIAAASDGADLTNMMDELIRLNAIDVSAGLEVVASAAEGRGLWGRSIAAVDRIARQLPQMVEAINRTVTAVASYRLARKDGQTHEQATQFALKMVRDTQGDYSAANAPRFFNNPILRPALQFKKYAQMMSYLLGDMMYRAFNGATPEEKKIALKQLGNIIGVQILMAGALSLPGLEIIKAAFLITSLFGLTGGWDDQEDKFRKLLDASVGKKWSELISSGILSRAIGIDLSQRMSLADMWLFGEPKGDTSENWQAYLFRQLTGAPGGYVIDAIEAGRLFVEEGEYLKGMGKILPAKFAADFAKAAHNYREGKYEEEKRRSVSGVGEAALNVFGFRSGRQAEVGRERGVAIRERQDMQKEFKKLQREYYRARTKGELVKAIAKNREWNETLDKSQWRLRLPVKQRDLRVAQ